MEYHRYLKEIIQTLETDAAFREKLQKADEADIRVSMSYYIKYKYYMEKNIVVKTLS